MREKKWKRKYTHTNTQTHEHTKLPIIPSIGRKNLRTNQDMAQNTFKE